MLTFLEQFLQVNSIALSRSSWQSILILYAGDSVMLGMTKQSDAVGQPAQNGIFEKKIVSAHCHPEFQVSSNNVLLNDICLLRIEAIGEAEFGSFGYTSQDKVCLPESNTVPALRCHAAGWGLTDTNDVDCKLLGIFKIFEDINPN